MLLYRHMLQQFMRVNNLHASFVQIFLTHLTFNQMKFLLWYSKIHHRHNQIPVWNHQGPIETCPHLQNLFKLNFNIIFQSLYVRVPAQIVHEFVVFSMFYPSHSWFNHLNIVMYRPIDRQHNNTRQQGLCFRWSASRNNRGSCVFCVVCARNNTGSVFSVWSMRRL
jgi:hypothetical protein